MANVMHTVDCRGEFIISPLITFYGIDNGYIEIDTNKLESTVQGRLLLMYDRSNAPLLVTSPGRDGSGMPINVEEYRYSALLLKNVGKEQKSCILVSPEYFSEIPNQLMSRLQYCVSTSLKSLRARVDIALYGDLASRILRNDNDFKFTFGFDEISNEYYWELND